MHACVHCAYRHDVTMVTDNANHVIMMSLAFMFHSYHVGMRWHDIIIIHVARAPCHAHQHDIGMTSLCSHSVRDVIMFA